MVAIMHSSVSLIEKKRVGIIDDKTQREIKARGNKLAASRKDSLIIYIPSCETPRTSTVRHSDNKCRGICVRTFAVELLGLKTVHFLGELQKQT